MPGRVDEPVRPHDHVQPRPPRRAHHAVAHDAGAWSWGGDVNVGVGKCDGGINSGYTWVIFFSNARFGFPRGENISMRWKASFLPFREEQKILMSWKCQRSFKAVFFFKAML